MKARSGGAVLVIAVGLVMAVAVPANAEPSASAAPAIVSAVHRGSSITMPSGYSHYIYVGGASANAVLSRSTFGGYPEGDWAKACTHKQGVDAVGPSTSPTGSFATDGSVAAIAGVGISGYTVKVAHPVGANGNGGTCSTGTPTPISDGFGWSASKRSSTYLEMIGTIGLATLTFAPNPSDNTCPTDSFKVLRNVTYGNPHSTSDPVASVAVVLVTKPPGDVCDYVAIGTQLPVVAGSYYAMWNWAYHLTPLKD